MIQGATGEAACTSGDTRAHPPRVSAPAAYLTCAALLVAVAPGTVPLAVVHRQLSKDYNLDSMGDNIIWFCSRGQFGLHNGVTMIDDNNPSRQGDGISESTVHNQLGTYYIKLFYQSGESEFLQIRLDQKGNVVVNNSRKWYNTSGVGC